MDFAARLDNRLGEVVDEAVDQAVEVERSEPFGHPVEPSMSMNRNTRDSRRGA